MSYFRICTQPKASTIPQANSNTNPTSQPEAPRFWQRLANQMKFDVLRLLHCHVSSPYAKPYDASLMGYSKYLDF